MASSMATSIPSGRRIVLLVHVVDTLLPEMRNQNGVHWKCKMAMERRLRDSYPDCELIVNDIPCDLTGKGQKVDCGIIPARKCIEEKKQELGFVGSFISIHVVLWKAKKRRGSAGIKRDKRYLDFIRENVVHVSIVGDGRLSQGDQDLYTMCSECLPSTTNGPEVPKIWAGWPPNELNFYLTGFTSEELRIAELSGRDGNNFLPPETLAVSNRAATGTHAQHNSVPASTLAGPSSVRLEALRNQPPSQFATGSVDPWQRHDGETSEQVTPQQQHADHYYTFSEQRNVRQNAYTTYTAFEAATDDRGSSSSMITVVMEREQMLGSAGPSPPLAEDTNQRLGSLSSWAAGTQTPSTPDPSLTRNLERSSRKRALDAVPANAPEKRPRLDNVVQNSTTAHLAQLARLAGTSQEPLTRRPAIAGSTGARNGKGRGRATVMPHAGLPGTGGEASTSRAVSIGSDGQKKDGDSSAITSLNEARTSWMNDAAITSSMRTPAAVSTVTSGIPLRNAVQSAPLGANGKSQIAAAQFSEGGLNSMLTEQREGPVNETSKMAKEAKGKGKERSLKQSSSIALPRPPTSSMSNSANPSVDTSGSRINLQSMPPPIMASSSALKDLFPSVAPRATVDASTQPHNNHSLPHAGQTSESISRTGLPDTSPGRPSNSFRSSDDSTDSLFDASYSISGILADRSMKSPSVSAERNRVNMSASIGTAPTGSNVFDDGLNARSISQGIRVVQPTADASTLRVQESDSVSTNSTTSSRPVGNVDIRVVCDRLMRHFPDDRSNPVYQAMFALYAQLQKASGNSISVGPSLVLSDSTNQTTDLHDGSLAAPTALARSVSGLSPASRRSSTTASPDKQNPVFASRRSSGVVSENKENVSIECEKSSQDDGSGAVLSASTNEADVSALERKDIETNDDAQEGHNSKQTVFSLAAESNSDAKDVQAGETRDDGDGDANESAVELRDEDFQFLDVGDEWEDPSSDDIVEGRPSDLGVFDDILENQAVGSASAEQQADRVGLASNVQPLDLTDDDGDGESESESESDSSGSSSDDDSD
ncbi:uncharacterized protein LAESUDRAFT_573956 [Laetiporus sulphureus 93-53]|uniref:Uncharacterized protein n=1 Tax=Laetiporus sulphureus 93-53 TaxID=1314785 RepID=A0A165B2Y9_9APHY|nr:uncharacterized protein LAESUDRAFT_573956 [Laetiporus sulphureus 93-53]KZT00121.1 hypothetical protein LAESUDRAFT_573956 [Laetiporus sulphureus 93-53]